MDGITQIYQTTQDIIADPHADPRFRDIHQSVYNIMDAGHQGERLGMPTHLSQEPVNLGHIPRPQRRRQRRPRQNAVHDEDEFVANQTLNLGDMTVGGNFETGGSSHIEHVGTSNVVGMSSNFYQPQFEPSRSFHGGFNMDWPSPTNHMTDFLTPTNFMNQAPTQDLLIDPTFGIQSYERPHFSEATPIPFPNFDLNSSPSVYPVNNQTFENVTETSNPFGYEEANEINNQRDRPLRRSSRDIHEKDCGTGHPLIPNRRR